MKTRITYVKVDGNFLFKLIEPFLGIRVDFHPDFIGFDHSSGRTFNGNLLDEGHFVPPVAQPVAGRDES